MHTKAIFTAVTLAFVIFLSGAMAVEGEVGELSESDLKPFCDNKEMWSAYKVSSEKCMVAAKACSKKNAGRSLNVVQATQALYNCVFGELGIKFPQ